MATARAGIPDEPGEGYEAEDGGEGAHGDGMEHEASFGLRCGGLYFLD